jgi:hypothetical protein
MNKTKNFAMHIIELARDIDVLDEIKARNKIIYFEFQELKNVNPEISVEVLIKQLAEKYFLGIDRMRELCYPKEKEDLEIIIEVQTPLTQKKVKRRYASRRRG